MSAVPGEGKSTVATGLSLALAQGQGQVMLIEADLRRPTLLHREPSLPIRCYFDPAHHQSGLAAIWYRNATFVDALLVALAPVLVALVSAC